MNDKKLLTYEAPSIKMEKIILEEGFCASSTRVKVGQSQGGRNNIQQDWGSQQQQNGDINWLG